MFPLLFSNKRRLVRQKLELAEQEIKQAYYNKAFQLCRECRQITKKYMSREVLYTGACALFGLGHVHQAKQWIEEYKSSAKQDSSYLYLTAYLALHHKQPEQALLNWTTILHLDPSQSFADRLIEAVKSGEKQVLEEVTIPDHFSRYVPIAIIKNQSSHSSLGNQKLKKNQRPQKRGLSKKFKTEAFFIVLGAFIALGGIFFGKKENRDRWFLRFPDLLFSFLFSDGKSLEHDLPKAPRRGTLIFPEQYKGEAPPFMYKKRSEFLADYEKARKKILSAKVNQARLILGRMELSNISFEMKERVLLLRSSIPFLERENFHDPISIKKVQSQAYFYRGAQIFWRAKLRAILPRTKEIILELEKHSKEKKNIKEETGEYPIELSSRKASEESSKEYKNRLIVSYAVHPSQRKEALSKLNVQNDIQVFGVFQGIEAGALKIKAHELVLDE